VLGTNVLCKKHQNIGQGIKIVSPLAVCIPLCFKQQNNKPNSYSFLSQQRMIELAATLVVDLVFSLYLINCIYWSDRYAAWLYSKGIFCIIKVFEGH
jgi:hypothetical protein